MSELREVRVRRMRRSGDSLELVGPTDRWRLQIVFPAAGNLF